MAFPVSTSKSSMDYSLIFKLCWVKSSTACTNRLEWWNSLTTTMYGAKPILLPDHTFHRTSTIHQHVSSSFCNSRTCRQQRTLDRDWWLYATIENEISAIFPWTRWSVVVKPSVTVLWAKRGSFSKGKPLGSPVPLLVQDCLMVSTVIPMKQNSVGAKSGDNTQLESARTHSINKWEEGFGKKKGKKA